MNILLFLVIILSFYLLDSSFPFWLAFVLGLVNDLILANLIGFSSIVFLSTCFLIYLYQRKFSSFHLFFQLGFLIFINLFLNIFFNQAFSWKNLAFFSSLALIIYLLVNRIRGKEATLIK